MTYGFIGCGNMGSAISLAAAKAVGGENIYLANRTYDKAQKLAEKIGANAVESNRIIAEKCDFIFLGVKPQMMKDMLDGIKDVLSARNDDFVLVTMAAGLSAADIKAMAGGDYMVIRIMPNTPCAIGEGMILYCCDGKVDEKRTEAFLEAMKYTGIMLELDENLIDAGSAISGCGPAYAFMFIEALADGGVECGLPRAAAVKLAAQMLSGSAKLLLETGDNPGKLKDAVCSPKGSTIAGVHALENKAFRSAAMDAVVSAYNRTKELGK